MKKQNLKFLILWLLVFTACLLLLSASFYPLLLHNEQERVEIIKIRETSNIISSAQTIRATFKELLGDAKTITLSPEIQNYVNHPGKMTRETAVNLLKAFCTSYLRYDQLRLFDEKGQELIRVRLVNGECVDVPEPELRNKFHRYFIQEGLKLGPNQVYVSPLDLQMDQDQLEIPLKPAIRVVARLTGPTENARMLLVVNYLAQDLLDRIFAFDQKSSGVESINLLLNDQGYYLKSENTPAKEFGFMFGREQDNFMRDNPDIWQAINAGQESVITAEGLYLLKTLDAALPWLNQANQLDAGPRPNDLNTRWRLVRFIPNHSLYANSILFGPNRMLWMALTFTIIAILSLIIAYFKLKSQYSWHRLKALMLAASHGIHIMNRKGDIIDCSHLFATMLGYTREEILKLNLADIDIQFTRSQHLENIRKLDESPAVFETKHRTKDGAIIDVEISARSVTIEGEIFYYAAAQNITEKKAALAALEVNRTLLQKIVEFSPSGLAVYNETGECILKNANFERILDLPPALLECNPFRLRDQITYCVDRGDYGPNVSVDEIIANVIQHLQTRQTLKGERLQGNGAWIEFHVIPLLNNMVLAHYFDITSHKQTNAALRQARNQLADANQLLRKSLEEINDLYNNSATGYHSVGPDGVIVKINDTELGWLGYRREEIENKLSIFQILSPESKRRCEAALPEFMRNKKINDLELDFLRKDGTIFSALVSSTAILDENGNFLRTRTTVLDITERKKAKEEQKRLIELLEASTDFVARTDLAGHIVYHNQAAKRMLGLDAAQDMSARTLEKIHPAWAARKIMQESIPKLLNQGYWCAESALLHEDGHEIPVSELLILHRDQYGHADSISMVIRDITALKQNETQLREAKEKAEIANIAKSSFLATMSHEIRTPLNAIIGVAHLLCQTGLTEQQILDLKIIKTAGDSLLTLINDILDLSMLEAGELKPEPQEFSLPEMMRELKTHFHPIAEAKGLGLDIPELDADIPDTFYADRKHLKQILTILLGNAVKFTKRGEVSLKIKRLESDQTPSIRLRFSVTDTGIGMTPAMLSDLFQPFMQADNYINRDYGGAGLGLAIVKRLAKLLNGTLSVTSAPGEGSNFTLQLPLQIGDAEQIAPAESGAAPNASGENAGADLPLAFASGKLLTDMHVLIVDDNSLNRTVVKRILAHEGAICTECDSGQAAINALTQNPSAYHEVLMDIQMPGMDGCEATEQIRRNLRLDLPIIALTAGATATERERAMLAGMNDFLIKPVDAAKLIKSILKFKDMQSSENSSPRPD